MKKIILPISLLLASACCFGADQQRKVRVTLKEEETITSSIYILNQSKYDIVARVEGFGVILENLQRKQYKLDTGSVNIAAGSKGCLQRTLDVTQVPIKSVLYILYASALMVRVASDGYGDINSEAHFKNPFDHNNGKTFVVTGMPFPEGGYQLKVRLAQE